MIVLMQLLQHLHFERLSDGHEQVLVFTMHALEPILLVTRYILVNRLKILYEQHDTLSA